MSVPAAPVSYDLADLFVDQPEWFARQTIPSLLAWLREAKSSVSFRLDGDGAPRRVTVRWDAAALRARIPTLDEDVAGMRGGESVLVEQVAQFGAYALAGVVSAAILTQRIVRVNTWSAPDLLWDASPLALRGVEVAGRSAKGLAGLRDLAGRKAPGLLRSSRVAEAHLSLWCKVPTVALLLKVRP